MPFLVSQSSDFDAMAPYYWIHSWVSFGLVRLWREKAIKTLALQPGAIVCYLMAGTGEVWPEIYKRIGSQGQIHAVDFSQKMLDEAKKRFNLAHCNVVFFKEDIFSINPKAQSMDAVICFFGSKLVAPDQWKEFIGIISRILKPGGTFCLLEVSLPSKSFFRRIFIVYLHLLQMILNPLGRASLPFNRLYQYLMSFQNFEGMTEFF